MKIIRLSTFLDFGGVETRLANISHVQDKNEWVFVCLNREGKAAERIKANHKKLINLNAKPSIYSFTTFLKVYKTLKKEKPDVIHTSGAEANFHGILAAKLLGIKRIIGEEIGTPNHSKKAQFIFSKLYSFADYVVGNSQAVLDVVHQSEKVPYRKLVKIDNPILFKDLSVYQKENFSDDIFHLQMISRLESVKNIEGVIRVTKKLIDDGLQVRLNIAGTGVSEDKLKELVSQFKLENEVSFTGFIKDPYPYLVNSDLYILNSFSEGFSNSLVEAMYSKTPSLSTDVGAAPEIIEDLVNGFLVPADNDEALLKKLKMIIGMSEQQRKEIGEKGHKTIVENFSLEKHIEELMKIYQ